MQALIFLPFFCSSALIVNIISKKKKSPNIAFEIFLKRLNKDIQKDDEDKKKK